MKRSKILAVILAVVMTLSTFSCLSVVSFAALIDSEVEKGEGENGSDIVKWELDSNGTLTIREDCENTWRDHATEIKKVIITDNVTSIPRSAFTGYENLAEVQFLKPLNSIGAYAFQDCEALVTLDIAGTTSIEDYAFYSCGNLTDVVIYGGLDKDVTGKNIFKDCVNLTNVELKNGTLTIGEGMFENCFALTNVIVPDSIVKIGNLAFQNCKNLLNITIPDSTTIVGAYAFYGCEKATTAYIGHNLTEIGEYLFGNCLALETVDINTNMPLISDYMFSGCKSLKKAPFTLTGVKKIGKGAFQNCTALADATFPTSLTDIGDSAFDNTALTTVEITPNITKIGKGVFTNCNKLTAINVDPKNTEYKSVDGVLYNSARDTLISCPAGKSGEYTVVDNTAALSNEAFLGCNLLTNITIPDSVTDIADTAFNGCSSALNISANCSSAAFAFAKQHGIKHNVIHAGKQQWVVTLEATCVAKGEKQLVCADCGEVLATEEIPALGHAFDKGVVTKNPTCTEDGEMTYSCTHAGCLETKKEVIPALGHAFDDGVVTKKPTCTEAGVMTYSCTHEGCLEKYTKEIPALGHEFDEGKVTKKATCTEDGEITYTCTHDGCFEKKTEVIKATGHKLDKGVVTKEATCTEDGVKTYTCTNDGCTYTETEVIPATGHSYKEEIIKPATCKENGKIKHTCEKCGDTFITEFKGEHQLYSEPVRVEPTCTKDGYEGMKCAVCGEFVGEVKVLPATGKHHYKDGVCVDCGAKDPNYVKPVDPKPNDPSKPATKAPATPKMSLVRNYVKGLNVTWQAVDNATGYRVYRRGAGDKHWTYLKTVKGTSFLDTKAATGKYWRYTVRAVGTAGWSGFENGIYLKRVDTPHMVSVKNQTAGVAVKWNAVSNAETYRVYRRGAGENWVYIGTTTNTSFLDTGVKNSTGYYRYTVRAVDGYYSNFESGLYLKRS